MDKTPSPGTGGDHIVVVIADDDVAINQLVCDILSDEGYTVLCCFSGAEAISVIRRVVPDLAIIDMQMETHDAGLKVLQSIRQSPASSHVKTIIFSADDVGLAQNKREIERYAGQMMRKPFSISRFVQQVRTLLSDIQP